MRCFTVLGPSQTGKSTVVEKLGALEGTPRKSVSPYGLNLTEFTFGDEAWCALDAPGGGGSPLFNLAIDCFFCHRQNSVNLNMHVRAGACAYARGTRRL